MPHSIDWSNGSDGSIHPPPRRNTQAAGNVTREQEVRYHWRVQTPRVLSQRTERLQDRVRGNRATADEQLQLRVIQDIQRDRQQDSPRSPQQRPGRGPEFGLFPPPAPSNRNTRQSALSRPGPSRNTRNGTATVNGVNGTNGVNGVNGVRGTTATSAATNSARQQFTFHQVTFPEGVYYDRTNDSDATTSRTPSPRPSTNGHTNRQTNGNGHLSGPDRSRPPYR